MVHGQTPQYSRRAIASSAHPSSRAKGNRSEEPRKSQTIWVRKAPRPFSRQDARKLAGTGKPTVLNSTALKGLGLSRVSQQHLFSFRLPHIEPYQPMKRGKCEKSATRQSVHSTATCSSQPSRGFGRLPALAPGLQKSASTTTRLLESLPPVCTIIIELSILLHPCQCRPDTAGRTKQLQAKHSQCDEASVRISSTIPLAMGCAIVPQASPGTSIGLHRVTCVNRQLSMNYSLNKVE